MTVKKQNSFLSFDLDWLQSKAGELCNYIDDNPINKLQDRTDRKQTMNGGFTLLVVSSVEKQVKSIRETLKDFALIIEAIGKLREKEAEEDGGEVFAQQSSYIEAELTWLEVKATALQQYIDDNPIDQIQDRKIERPTARGSTYLNAATIEDQIKCIRDTLKDYTLLVDAVNRLYAKEKARKELRGGSKANLLMEDTM